MGRLCTTISDYPEVGPGDLCSEFCSVVSQSKVMLFAAPKLVCDDPSEKLPRRRTLLCHSAEIGRHDNDPSHQTEYTNHANMCVSALLVKKNCRLMPLGDLFGIVCFGGTSDIQKTAPIANTLGAVTS